MTRKIKWSKDDFSKDNKKKRFVIEEEEVVTKTREYSLDELHVLKDSYEKAVAVNQANLDEVNQLIAEVKSTLDIK